MWEILESADAQRILPKLPKEIRAKYEKWQDIVRFGGPSNLRVIRGFRDEALSGAWEGYRSSRLNLQWRVIYFVENDKISVTVEKVTPHRLSEVAMAKRKKYSPAKRYAHLSIGEGLRVLRELQEMTQAELAAESGVPQAAISALENGRLSLGLERARKLARALKVHPAVIAFPDWDYRAA